MQYNEGAGWRPHEHPPELLMAGNLIMNGWLSTELFPGSRKEFLSVSSYFYQSAAVVVLNAQKGA